MGKRFKLRFSTHRYCVILRSKPFWFLNLEPRQKQEGSIESKFFCELSKDGDENLFHPVQSFRLDEWVSKCAQILNDIVLHAKLQNGDMIAQDAVFRGPC